MRKTILIAASAVILAATTFTMAHSGGKAMQLKVTSPAFSNKGNIPREYTSDGSGVSPEIKWSSAPSGTKSFVMIVDDPDAPSGTFTHWVIFDIPATVHELPKNVPTTETLPNGARQGMNSAHKIGWTPPSPPHGMHEYDFRVYAMDKIIDLKPGCSKVQLLDAMNQHVLAQGEIAGFYTKKK